MSDYDDGPIAPRSLDSWLNPDDTVTPDDLRPETARTDAARYARQKHHPLKTVPPQALLAARTALRDAQSTNDADVPEMIGPVADAILAAGLHAIFEFDTEHLLKLTNTGTWVVQHPLSCRPNLFSCPLAEPGLMVVHAGEWEAGVYVVTLEHATLRLGERRS